MTLIRKGLAAAGLSALALTIVSSCAVTGVGATVGVGYDAGYYEPWGYDYGGWGNGYRVGPGRRGDPRGGHPRSYRPAPSSRPMPSIPNRPRGARR